MHDSRSILGRPTTRCSGGAGLHWPEIGWVAMLALLAAPDPGVAQVQTLQPGAPGDPTRVLGPTDLSTLSVPSHTEADLGFMQSMILHHEQALEMTALVPSRATTQEMRLLARRIQASQLDEVRFMERWLAERGGVSGPAGHEIMGAGHATPIPGMLGPEQMAVLRSASGREFDQLFLEGMIQHHEGAVMMVRNLAAVGSGQEAELSAFASHVESDQSIEIRRMRQMLEDYSDPVGSPR
jgi:uncharacterized protein (DUF305 family)